MIVVNDVALNYSFKHLIKTQFEDWAVDEIYKQLENNSSVKLETGMKIIKPRVLDWCVNSWEQLKERKDLIRSGWNKCMNEILDPFDKEIQVKSFEKVTKSQLNAYGFIFDKDEPENASDYYHYVTDSDSDDDELDPLKRRVYGTRKSDRISTQPKVSSYMIASDKIVLDSDSDSDVDIDLTE